MRTIKINDKRLIALTMLLLLTTTINYSPIKAQSTELPVPRDESVIMEIFGTMDMSESYNPLVPGGSSWGGAYHTIGIEYDWYYDYTTDAIIYWRITGWEYSDDFTTFTMYIRQGVTWNDGEPYTSKDVAYTLELLKENALLDGHQYVEEWVESVETPDDYTVVIHLNKANSRFQHTFRMWGNIPSEVAWHIWKDVNVTTFTNWPPVETGPYKVYAHYDDLKMVVYIRDENYWGKTVFGMSPGPKYVIVRQAPSQDIDLADLIRGDLDMPIAWSIDWDWANQAAALSQQVVVNEWLDPCSSGIMGINVGRYPLNITDFRWAIAYAIDYEKVAMIGSTKGEPAEFPWQRGWATTYRYADLAEEYKLEYDTTRAEEILDNLGFVDTNGDGWREKPDGSALSIEVDVQSSGSWPDVGNELVLELQDIGINAALKTMGNAEYGDAREFGYFDIICGGLCSGIEYTNDLIYTLDTFHSKWYAPEGERSTQGMQSAAIRYRNAELDAIIDEIWNLTQDDPQAAILYKEGLEILMRDCLFIPLTQGPTPAVFSTKYWTNWPTPSNNYQVVASWWPTLEFILFELEPTQGTVEYTSVWITGDVPAFTGEDGKTYGPFVNGENPLLPMEDAEQLIADDLASYAMPGLTEMTTAITQIQTSLSNLAAQNSALASSMSNLTIIASVEGIGTIVLAIALIMVIRKKE